MAFTHGKGDPEERRRRAAKALGGSCAHGGKPGSCPKCMADGGEVGSKGGPTSMREKMAQTPRGGHIGSHGGPTSMKEKMGMTGEAPRRHYAEGGEAEPMEPGGDEDDSKHELMEACADELVEALEKKDTRAIVDAIRALVLNCKE